MPIKQISIKMPEAEADQLYKTARKYNRTVAEQARRYIHKGMAVDAYQNDEDKILANMQAALKEVLEPQVNRMVKIMVKNSISSTMGLLFTSLFIMGAASKEVKARMGAMLEEARQLSIRYVALKDGSVDEFLKSALQKILGIWEA